MQEDNRRDQRSREIMFYLVIFALMGAFRNRLNRVLSAWRSLIGHMIWSISYDSYHMDHTVWYILYQVFFPDHPKIVALFNEDIFKCAVSEIIIPPNNNSDVFPLVQKSGPYDA